MKKKKEIKKKEIKIKNKAINFFKEVLLIIVFIFIVTIIILSLGTALILIGFIYARQNNYYDWETKEKLEKEKWSREI